MHGQVPNPGGRETLMATNGNGYVWFPQGFDMVVAHESGLDEAHEAMLLAEVAEVGLATHTYILYPIALWAGGV